MKFSFLIAFCLLTQICVAQQSLTTVFQSAQEAYKQQEHAEFLRLMQTADSMRANHPTILYNLAAGHSLNGHSDEAIAALRRTLWMNANPKFEADSDFVAMATSAGFEALKEEIADLRTPKGSAQTVFEIDDADFHPEGLAWDAQTGRFFVSGVRGRAILVADKNGKVSEFVNEPGLYSLMGLAVDTERRLLWVCSTPTTEMQPREGDPETKFAEVVKIDVDSGKILKRYPLSRKKVWLGDLVVRKADGAVFASSSDTDHPAIFKVNEETGKLDKFIHKLSLASLQGLTFDAQGENLFFSDYRHGLFKLNLATKAVTKIGNTTHHPLKGIDGLYYQNGSLLAVHNGLRPMRLVKYDLNDVETEVTDFEIINSSIPQMENGEPTLGVMTTDGFHYIANSPWPHYNRDGSFNKEKAGKGIVVRVE